MRYKETGTTVANYTYDAWGNLLTTTGPQANTIGRVNPLRYRGWRSWLHMGMGVNKHNMAIRICEFMLGE